ncbi:MAG TPA: murein biosynthesis integral membrane protein MurJ, partial [Ktedonobacteraceae bacterium]|nr:murein biosynthesis integral membrane protein MurJ [Ktedonobacteraceae bacterium]
QEPEWPVPSQPLAQPAMPPYSQEPEWPASSQPFAQPSVPSNYQEPEWPVPSEYQEPLLDMGSSLGYGQGMEYQYFNAPQPSQPLPMVRQTRLQQLRAERMRRQQGGQRDPNTMQGGQSQAQEQGLKPASLFSHLFSGPATPLLPHVSAPPSTSSRSLWGTPPVPPETPPVASTNIEDMPTTPMEPRGLAPAGMLSLPSRPLPAVSMGASGMLTAKAAEKWEKQDTGSRQKAVMARATMILTGSFIVGRILGLIRTSLFAFVFGTTLTSDAYLQAFLIPDLIFNVVAGGALSSAFIPVFTHYMVGEKDEKTAWRVASSAFNLALAIMCLLALIAIILAPWLVPLYNPRVPASELGLIITLTRIMLLQSIIMGGGVIVNSVLYARQNFLLPAVGTVLYNVGLIIGLLPGFFLTFVGRSDGFTTFAVYAATVGVILGAIFQVGVQIPGILKEKVHYTPSFDWKHPGVIQIGRQMLPRALNAAMLYFSTFVDRGLILLLAVGVLAAQQQGLITQYYQALQLMLLPLGIFGMAVSTAAFPTMAENVTLGRLDRVRAIIEDTLRSILFLSIPSSIGLIVLGLPIIQVLLQHGAFSLNSATSTSVPLAFFAIGLAGLACVEILTRSFYAFRDSKTPVIVSVSQFVLKILLSLILLQVVHAIQWGSAWGLGALAFSTSVAGLLEAAVLLYLLQKKIGMLELRKLARFAGRVLLASLAMGLILLMLRFVLDFFLMTTAAQNLGVLGTIMALLKLAIELAGGILVYIWATRQLGIKDFWEQGPVRRVLDRLRLSWI